MCAAAALLPARPSKSRMHEADDLIYCTMHLNSNVRHVLANSMQWLNQQLSSQRVAHNVYRRNSGLDQVAVAAGGAYAILVRRQLSAGASQAESLASLDADHDSSNQQTPSVDAPQAASPRYPSDAMDGDARQFREGSGSPDPRGRPPSPRPPRRGQLKPYRSADMTRQDTSAIVDAVMADVIGGGFDPQHDAPSGSKSGNSGSPHDNGHA